MPNVNAYGFMGLQELYNTRITQAGPQRIYDAIVESELEYTRVLNALLSEWVERTVVAQEQFELPGTGTLQPLDEYGNPLPVVPSGKYQVAYPIQGGGTAWGDDRVSRAFLTVGEANRNTVDAEMRDKDWMLRHILAAILTNVAWTFNDKIGPNGSKGLGNITIRPFAIASDGVVYQKTGATAPATDTHFLAQANAISDTDNPFPGIFTEINEHPSNRNRRVIAYVASDLVDDITNLADFVGVTAPDVVPASTTPTLTNIPDVGVGDRVLGHVGQVWIIEWGLVPSGYMIAKAEGVSPLAMREYDAPQLQDFFPENFSPDGNRFINRMIRYAGFAARRRVAAIVMHIGNGSYAVPTGFLAPLAV